MRKLGIAFVLLFFASSIVFARDWLPVNKLELDVQDVYTYAFDGTATDIPIEVIGAPSRTVLVITTKDKAAEIPRITNGRIGWHTVNGIDTTVYLSPAFDLEQGSRTVSWPGTDDDGAALPSGEYYYYVWGFDYVNTEVKAVPRVVAGWHGAGVLTEDQDGVPLDRPIFHSDYYFGGVYDGESVTPDFKTGDYFKWQIGDDPYNLELMESCFLPPPDPEWAAKTAKGVFVPGNYNEIIRFEGSAGIETLYKYLWNPNDIGEVISDWGTDLRWTYPGGGDTGGIDADGTYIFMVNYEYSKTDCNAYVMVADFDGYKVADVFLEDQDKAAYVEEHEDILRVGGPLFIDVSPEGHIAHSGIWCLAMLSDINRYLESGEYDDFVLGINEEGDGLADKGWSDDNPAPDYCNAEDPPWLYDIAACKYDFVIRPTAFYGPVSFVVNTPDQTGIDYFALAGEDAGRSGTIPLESGTAYDGLYIDNSWYGSDASEDRDGSWFIGMGSDKGVIKPTTSVEAAAPAAFAVAQNTPNPCNPTTTINFTIPEAGNITVDIFNVAGQKVDTLVNDFMDAGTHSVVWDGSSNSSGVYFYTVTSGEFSKTMKMTLLR